MNENLTRDSIDGLPEYIPGKQVEEVAREYGIDRIIKMASDENPLGPSPKAVQAIRDLSSSSSVYPDQNHAMLREALAAKLGLSTENLIIGNGSDEIMLLIAQVFLSAGDEVVIAENTFSMYEFVTKIMDGKCVFVPLKDNVYDLNAMAQAINGKTKIVFLCNPNNPTGTIFYKEQFNSFLKKLPSNVIVVVDEAYGEFVDDTDYPNGAEYLLNKGLNLIVLRTFSKLFGLAGLRIGYGISRPDLIKYLNLAKMPFNVNRIGQAAAQAALADDEFIKNTLVNNSEGKKYLYAELDKLGLKYEKTQANFLMIEFDFPADEIFLQMLKKGIIIRPLISFGIVNAIRVTIGTREQNEQFISALQEILQ